MVRAAIEPPRAPPLPAPAGRRRQWLAGLIGLLAGFSCSACLLFSGNGLGATQELRKVAARANKAESDLIALRQSMETLRNALHARIQECDLRGDNRTTASAASAAGRGVGEVATHAWDDTPENFRIHEMIQKVANPRREIMLALANDVMMCSNRKTCWWNGGNVLKTFLEGTSRLKMSNVVIITLDDETEKFCQKFGGVNSLRLELPVPKAQHNSRGANMISTLKYGLLKQILLMGFACLVVDLDLVFLQDPFDHLYRDADVEASTDGFTKAWAGGSIGSIHEPKMGWGAGGLYVQHFTLNVGCAYFRPTIRAIDLLQRVSDSLAARAGWDQQVFNSEVFMLSHGSYNGSKVGVRVMEYSTWLNSKTFFFTERNRYFPGKTSDAPLPVMVHMNYHPDKHKRMLCVWARYVEGRKDACDGLPAAG